MDNVPNLIPVVTVTEPTAHTLGLNTVPSNTPVHVPVCKAQLGGLSSMMMHGAEVPPMISKLLTQISADTNTQ